MRIVRIYSYLNENNITRPNTNIYLYQMYKKKKN